MAVLFWVVTKETLNLINDTRVCRLTVYPRWSISTSLESIEIDLGIRVIPFISVLWAHHETRRPPRGCGELDTAPGCSGLNFDDEISISRGEYNVL